MIILQVVYNKSPIKVAKAHFLNHFKWIKVEQTIYLCQKHTYLQKTYAENIFFLVQSVQKKSQYIFQRTAADLQFKTQYSQGTNRAVHIPELPNSNII